MRKVLIPSVLATAMTLILSAPAHSAQVDASKPVGSISAAQEAPDKPSATPRGTTFIVPAAFSQRAQGNAVLLMPPEADGSRIAIIDAVADNPDAAVAEGWKLLGMTPKLLVATDAAPRDGWEARRFYEYDVAANAKRVISARAFRKGKAWTVMVVDVDQAIAEKRSSQFGKIGQRLQPAGHTHESFAGRTAHKLDAARLQQVAGFVEQMRKDYNSNTALIPLVLMTVLALFLGFHLVAAIGGGDMPVVVSMSPNSPNTSGSTTTQSANTWPSSSTPASWTGTRVPRMSTQPSNSATPRPPTRCSSST